MHGLYLGGVFTAISQGVPAGISALIPGLQPILTSTIANQFMGETVTRVQWIGLVLGLLGVLLVLHDRSIVLQALRLARRELSLPIGITLGTLYQKRLAARSIGVREPCSIHRSGSALRSDPLRLKHAGSTGRASSFSRSLG